MTEQEIEAIKVRADAYLADQRAKMSAAERANDRRVSTVCLHCFEPECRCAKPLGFWGTIRRLLGGAR